MPRCASSGNLRERLRIHDDTLSTRVDFNGDPADELIAATSVVHAIPLLTRDSVIQRSKLVPPAR